MDSILVFNTGSTSISYHRYTAHSLELLFKGKYAFTAALQDRKEFLKIFRSALREIGSLTDVVGIGHRIVHGGDQFHEPTLIDDHALHDLQTLKGLAPLHNPWNIAGIEACREYLESIPNVGVFDTGFFATLPPEAYLYALPPAYAHYRRYGFHGISHASVMEQLSQTLNKPARKLTFISCHLGGGSSVALIDKGQPLDVSMGYTPLEGLIMMTRTGDLDPGIVLDMIQKAITQTNTIEEARAAVENIEAALYRDAGLKGLAGAHNYLELLTEKTAGNPHALMAFTLFVRRIKKYIGAYAALVPKLDAICFTGSIGAGESTTRDEIVKGLPALKKVPVYSFSPAEELTIARTVQRVLSIDAA